MRQGTEKTEHANYYKICDARLGQQAFQSMLARRRRRRRGFIHIRCALSVRFGHHVSKRLLRRRISPNTCRCVSSLPRPTPACDSCATRNQFFGPKYKRILTADISIIWLSLLNFYSPPKLSQAPGKHTKLPFPFPTSLVASPHGATPSIRRKMLGGEGRRLQGSLRGNVDVGGDGGGGRGGDGDGGDARNGIPWMRTCVLTLHRIHTLSHTRKHTRTHTYTHLHSPAVDLLVSFPRTHHRMRTMSIHLPEDAP